MKTNELREKYLAFFESKGHQRVASDVLVPTWDPTVLFTPAGMNQFKDHFLGKVALEYTRATTCQKCLRTGDIDNVGRTAYHHTFFEMLGNFSFGDYFKRDAINWAWEFLTDKKWLGLDPNRLTVTVYKEDEEAARFWANDIKLDEKRIIRMDEDENFWPASAPSLGPDGVCGPCSEIYYHPEVGPEVEIWNLVFTQFNRVGDPPNNLQNLPSQNIDTGMGLERIVATLQGVETNYHIDSILPIVEAAAEITGQTYSYDSENGRRLRRITDHIRACAFAVHENVYPGPQKEKYIIKRLLRRAVLDGHQMGLKDPFLYQMVPVVAEVMGTAYPELLETTERVARVIKKEEENFLGTLDGGLHRVDSVFETMKKENRTSVSGAVAADLYQTFGVPPELFESLAQDNGLSFDWAGYRAAMEVHGEVSGGDQKCVMGSKGPLDALKTTTAATQFVGYEADKNNAVVQGILVGCNDEQELVPSISADEAASTTENMTRVVLDETAFYGESGGQVGDIGTLTGEGFEFKVTDTQKDGSLFLHIGELVCGTLTQGAAVATAVDSEQREAIKRAHSVTHILHYALQKNVGQHAQQQGSKVDADWLRFDFTNLEPVSPELLEKITADVQSQIMANEPIDWQTLPLAEARSQGAMMLFGEKYPDPVRMVSMGQFSKELCGGTHLTNTGEVGAFEIISEEGVSAGTRRIIAITGKRAEKHAAETKAAVTKVAKMLDVDSLGLAAGVAGLLEQQRAVKKSLATGHPLEEKTKATVEKVVKKTVEKNNVPTFSQLKKSLADTAHLLSIKLLDVPERVAALQSEIKTLKDRLTERLAAGPLTAESLLESAQTIDGVTVVTVALVEVDTNLMRHLIDQIRTKSAPAAVLLASVEGADKVTLVAGISKDLQDRGLNAGHWIRPVAQVVGGGGGGRADMAQAGGKDASKVSAALEMAKETIAKMLKV